MGIDLGSVGAALGPNGLLGLTGTFLTTMNNFVKGIGYFAGGDFQTAFDAGFMA